MSKSGSSSGNKNQGSSGSGVPRDSPPPISRNRFLKSGNQAVYEVIETKDSVIYRVDLPGCPASDLTYWVDGNNVHFFADEPVMSEYDHDGRRYGGTMVFNPVANKVNEAKAKLRDGVLWITVPKVPGINVKRVGLSLHYLIENKEELTEEEDVDLVSANVDTRNLRKMKNIMS